MESLLKGLNNAQTRAVTSPSDVVQVLAPPGSGKTKTLTARVAYLIDHHGYRPWNIVVCTFTNKAAREMKERIKGLLGDNLEKRLVLGTFHAIALRYLRSYGHYIGIKKDFGIADSNDTMAILKRIKQRHKFGIEPGVARSRISKVKARSSGIKPIKGEEMQEFNAVMQEYEDALRTSNFLDYDDLLLRCADLLREHGDCVSNVEAVLIDEFQDTNHVQYELMSLFSQRRHRITIVGDPDQSIYAFRSAEVANVLKMQRQYPEAHVVYLEENYRSSGAILMSALAVIEQDTSRPAKPLLPTHAIGEQPVLRRLPHPRAEGLWMADELKRVKQLAGGLLTYSDFAILLRSGHQSQAIELALGKAGIPYRMVGGHKFFDRWEIKVLLSYLRVISTPQHNDAIIHVINEPPRGIGDETSKRLVEEAENRKMSLWQLLQNIAQERGRVETKVRTAQRRGICEFFGLITKARNKLTSAQGPATVVELLDLLISKLSFGEHLRKKYGEDAESRRENIEELRNQAIQLCSNQGDTILEDEDRLPTIDGIEQAESEGPAAALSRFLANVALATDAQAGEEGQASQQVTISTMHGAKGLEWPVVFVASLFEGSMPHSRADDHDEERRLLYVAMTRAQTLLYLSCPMKASGGNDASPTVLSPFLSSRAMASLFRVSGASMPFSMVQDLARILRRKCPSDKRLVEAFEAAELREDDTWPTNGEDPGRKNEVWTMYGRADDISSAYPQKRRRIGNHATGDTYTSTIVTATTMLSASSYSVSSSTLPVSFMSASSCLQQQAQVAAAKKERAPREEGSTAKTLIPNKVASSQASKATQGSIMSFFGKQVTAPVPAPKAQDYAKDDDSVKENSKPETVNERRPPFSGSKAASTFHATSMSHMLNAPKSLGLRRQPVATFKVNRPFKPLSRPNG